MKKLILSTALVALTTFSAHAQQVLGDIGVPIPPPGTVTVNKVEPASVNDANPKITATTKTVNTSGWYECSYIPDTLSVTMPPSVIMPASSANAAWYAGWSTQLTDKDILAVKNASVKYSMLHSGYNRITTGLKLTSKIDGKVHINMRTKSYPAVTPLFIWYGKEPDVTRVSTSPIDTINVTKSQASELEFAIDNLYITSTTAGKKLNDIVSLATLNTDVRIHLFASCSNQ